MAFGCCVGGSSCGLFSIQPRHFLPPSPSQELAIARYLHPTGNASLSTPGGFPDLIPFSGACLCKQALLHPAGAPVGQAESSFLGMPAGATGSALESPLSWWVTRSAMDIASFLHPSYFWFWTCQGSWGTLALDHCLHLGRSGLWAGMSGHPEDALAPMTGIQQLRQAGIASSYISLAFSPVRTRF